MGINDNTCWVFGYGSLIWRPGFTFVRQEIALLRGLHRELCVYSYRHRGTEARPGLVFGLMQGGSCRGMGFEVSADRWPEVHAYLHEREMDRGVYLEARRPITLQGGRTVPALCFVADPRHVQYAGRLALSEQLRLVRDGAGESGRNPDYVLETARRLDSLGIRDRHLEEVVAALGGVDLPVTARA
jgi:cation transport protein ChaC